MAEFDDDVFNDDEAVTETEKGKTEEPEAKAEEETKEKSQVSTDSSIDDPMMPEGPSCLLLDDPSTKERCLAALKGYYAYHISALQHRLLVFKWQLFASKAIFVVVLVLVFTGIYFAFLQFHAGLSRKGSSKVAEGDQRTELVASLKGIKVSSPILGVIILVISFMFFYLYLVYVYPIEEIF